jgi:hypothetical protein
LKEVSLRRGAPDESILNSNQLFGQNSNRAPRRAANRSKHKHALLLLASWVTDRKLISRQEANFFSSTNNYDASAAFSTRSALSDKAKKRREKIMLAARSESRVGTILMS